MGNKHITKKVAVEAEPPTTIKYGIKAAAPPEPQVVHLDIIKAITAATCECGGTLVCSLCGKKHPRGRGTECKTKTS